MAPSRTAGAPDHEPERPAGSEVSETGPIPAGRVLSPRFWLFALLALAVIRLPWRLSPLYVLDSDEAILGLMARHIAEGSAFPVYFYGQSYGVALVETLPVALAFRVFGDDSVVLSLTVMLLFFGGLLAWAVGLARLAGSVAWGRVLALLMASLPVWVVWSLKARGLYVGGFVLTGVALALLSHPSRSRRRVVAVGLLSGLLYQVQPLWLVAVIPFVALREVEIRDAVWGLGAAAGVALALEVAAFGLYEYWTFDPIGRHPLGMAGLIPEQLVEMFSGDAYPHDPGPWARALGLEATIAFAAVTVLLPFVWLRTRRRAVLIAGFAMAASLLYAPFLSQLPPRYLIPSSVLLFVGLAAWVGAFEAPWDGLPRLASIVALLLLWAGALRIGHESPGGTQRSYAEVDMLEMIDALEARGVEGVYSTSPGLGWQILFYGGERIMARSLRGTDRVPAYPRAVDSLHEAGAQTALIGVIGESIEGGVEVEFGPPNIVARRYFGQLSPSDSLLTFLGFEQAGG